MNNDNKRIEYLDIIRGIAIIMVVIGHACIPRFCNQRNYILNLYLLINSINMPIFFYLSGFIFYNVSQRKDLKNIIKRKSRTLLMPYICYLSFVYSIIIITKKISVISRYLIKMGYYENYNLKSIFLDFIFCKGLLDKHVWFIYVLFWVIIFSTICIKLKISPNTFLTFDLIIVCILLVLKIDVSSLLWKIFYYFIFFNLASFKFDINKKNEYKLACAMFMVLEIIFLFYISWLDKHVIVERVLKFFIGLTSLPIFWNIHYYIKKNIFRNIFTYVGKKSFIIYLLHQPFIVSGSATLLYNFKVPILGCITIATILGIVVPLVLEFVYRNYSFINKVLKRHSNQEELVYENSNLWR